MNILVFTTWYPDENCNIKGVFVKEQVKALINVGINPVVFYPFDKSIEKGKIEFLVEDGIETYKANTDYIKNSKLSRINSIIRCAVLLKKVIEENKIDLIHCHVCYSSGFSARLYNKFFHTPYIITEHMSYIRDFIKKPYNKKLFYSAYKNAKNVICVSSYLMEELKNMGFIFDGKVVPNVVNVEEFYMKKSHCKDNYNILFIGRMDKDEVKGIKYLIPALANVIEKNRKYNLKLTLVGDGTKRNEYEELSQEYGIQGNCNFVGSVSKESIPDYIANCDFLVLSSIKETFGSVLIEAMAGGKPVIATRCGGPEDIIDDKVGILVEKESVEALENGIKEMIESYDKFDSKYIRDTAFENYSYEAVGNKLKNIYSNILKK